MLLWILGISLSISALCSILEAVLLSVTHSYVEVLKDQGSNNQVEQLNRAWMAAVLRVNHRVELVGRCVRSATALPADVASLVAHVLLG